MPPTSGPADHIQICPCKFPPALLLKTITCLEVKASPDLNEIEAGSDLNEVLLTLRNPLPKFKPGGYIHTNKVLLKALLCLQSHKLTCKGKVESDLQIMPLKLSSTSTAV